MVIQNIPTMFPFVPQIPKMLSSKSVHAFSIMSLTDGKTNRDEKTTFTFDGNNKIILKNGVDILWQVFLNILQL